MNRAFRLALALSVLTMARAGEAQDRTITLLQQLTDTAGPPGFEEPIRKVMVDLMRPLAASLTFDGLGSIVATQGTQGPRVMVDAHMDELGGMIRRVTPRGLLTMQMLGGWRIRRWSISAGSSSDRRDRFARSPESAMFTWSRPTSERASIRATACSSMSGRRARRRSPRWVLLPAIRWCPMRRSPS